MIVAEMKAVTRWLTMRELRVFAFLAAGDDIAVDASFAKSDPRRRL
jgi:hypothetical protein